MRRNVIPYFLGVFFLLGAQKLAAHMTAGDPGFSISSDFGPRIYLHNGASSYDFHKAIDYGATEGTSLPAIESGTITGLYYGEDTDILILTLHTTTLHDFRYLHMFNNTPLPIDSGEFTLTKTLTGELCIVHWLAGSNRTIADYALATVSGKTPVINGITVKKNAEGDEIATTNQGKSPIGPAGTSGGYAAHMHIDMGYGVSQSPLAHIEHAVSNYVLQFLDKTGAVRTNGFLVKSDDADTTFVKVKLDSRAGKDLDRLQIYVDKQDEAHRIRDFRYGGLTAAPDPVNTDIELDLNSRSNGLTNGVQPIDTDGNGESEVGLENFVYNNWESAQAGVSPSSLSDGTHRLIACWTNIRNQTDCSSSVDFIVDTEPPIVGLAGQQYRGTRSYYNAFYGPSGPGNIYIYDMQNNFSGLSRMSVSGPSGEIMSRTFSPPVAVSNDTYLSNLAPGQYFVTAVDSFGNKTIAPFIITEINISTSGSAQYNPISGEFTVNMTCDINSSFALDHVDLIDAGLRLRQTQLMSGNSGRFKFTISGKGWFALRVWSKCGVIRQWVFSFDVTEWSARSPKYVKVGNSYVEVPLHVDMVGEHGMLPGGAVLTAVDVFESDEIGKVNTLCVSGRCFSDRLYEKGGIMGLPSFFQVSGYGIISVKGVHESDTLTSEGIGLLPIGTNISVPLWDGARIVFDQITSPGNLHAYASLFHGPDDLAAEMGYTRLSSISIDGEVVFNSATLSFKYDSSGLTGYQENSIKLLRYNFDKGEYEEIPSTIDISAKTITARISPPADFDIYTHDEYMAVASVYSDPTRIQSIDTVSGLPEMEFVSDNSIVTSELLVPGSPVEQQVKSMLRANNMKPLSQIYLLGPDGAPFSPSATIHMRYDKNKLLASGISESSLGLYEFTADGGVLLDLQGSVDAEKGEIVAQVSGFHSLFAILSNPEATPARPKDILAPKTKVGFGGFAFFNPNGIVYVSTDTRVGLNPRDFVSRIGVISGVAATYYEIDPSPDVLAGGLSLSTTGNFEIFSGTFTLHEGMRTIAYGSVDNAGNYEQLRTKNVYVDGMPSVTELQITSDGLPVSTEPVNGVITISTGAALNFASADPEINGVASGVNSTRYLVDVPTGTCDIFGAVISTSAPAGTCENPAYSGPFTLSAGTHTIAYAGIDNVGNREAVKTALLNVENHYSISSGTFIGGNPEITVAAQREITLAQLSVSESTGAVVLASASAQGLVPVSNIYDLGPEGVVFNPPLAVTFHYSTSALAGLNIPESNVFLYHYNASAGWEKVAGQVIDTSSKTITAEIPVLTSIFGILGAAQDVTPPVTELQVIGYQSPVTTSPVNGIIYINGNSSITLTAVDPVINGVASGVLRTELAIDTTEYSVYSSTFMLTEGTHVLTYRSVDNAGNMETPVISTIAVDATAPVSEALISGTTGWNGWYISPATVTVISTDAMSGVNTTGYRIEGAGYGNEELIYTGPVAISSDGVYSVYYRALDNTGNMEPENPVSVRIDKTPPVSTVTIDGTLRDGAYDGPVFITITGTDTLSGVGRGKYSLDGGIFTSYLGSFTVVAVNSEGPHTLVFTSKDMAGNGEPERTLGFVIRPTDKTAPLTTATITGVAGLNGWYNSPVEVTIVSTDAFSGVSETLYSLDGSTFAVIGEEWLVAGDTNSFIAYRLPLIAGEGEHALKFRATDKAGNAEAEQTLFFKIDLSSPVVTALAAPPANEYGWNKESIAVTFAGTDTVSGTAYCSPQSVLDVEGSSLTVSGYCSDYSGLSNTVTYVVSIDTTMPSITVSISPSANAEGWNNTDVAGHFDCSDALSGVKSCPSDYPVAGEGVNISTSGETMDYAGNVSSVSVSGINIDRTAPLSTATLDGTYNNGWYGSPVEVTIVSTDNLSGIAGIYYSLDGGAYAAYNAPVTVNGEGEHTVKFKAADKAGNIETEQGVIFRIDTTAPGTELQIGGYRSQDNGITYINGSSVISFTATDPVVNGAASGVLETLYRIDDGSFTAYVSPFALTVDGEHTLAFYSKDKAGNVETEKTASFVLDATAPEAVLVSPLARGQGVDRIFKGNIPVTASLSDANFKDYRLEYASGQDAQSGFITLAWGTAPVSAVTVWNTSGLSGYQTLRLTASDLAGNVTVSTAAVFIGGPSLNMTISGLKKPEGVAVDENGNIYAADTEKDEVLKFGPDGNLIARFMGEGPSTSLRIKPGDRGEGSFDYAQDKTKDEKKEKTAGFKKPAGIAVSGDFIYVADKGNNRIAILNSTGTVIKSLGKTNPEGKFIPGKGPGEFNHPTGIAAKAGRVAVADRSRVQVFDENLAFLFEIKPVTGSQSQGHPSPDTGSPVTGHHDTSEEGEEDREETDDDEFKPFGVAMDDSGNIYVTDRENGKILAYNSDGSLLAALGSEGKEAGQFESPRGIAVSRYIYVADKGNKRIQKTDVKGTPLLAFGKAFELEQPVGVALDTAGNIYITDRKEGKLLKFGLGTSNINVSLKAEEEVETAETFKLRRTYAYPNPAIDYKHPVIRVETGIADRVEISIYDSSGRLIEETSITGKPVLNNGTYAYEYKFASDKTPYGTCTFKIKAYRNGYRPIEAEGKLMFVKWGG